MPTHQLQSPQTNGQKKWTYEGIAALLDDRLRELHDGVLIIVRSPTLQHQKIYRRLLKLLEA